MDFEHTKKTKDLMALVSDFINTNIRPSEKRYTEEMEAFRAEGDPWRVPEVLYELKLKAKDAGLWNFSLTGDLGYGLTNLEFAPLAEMMGVGWTSEVFNSSAPVFPRGRLPGAAGRGPQGRHRQQPGIAGGGRERPGAPGGGRKRRATNRYDWPMTDRPPYD